MCIPGFVLLFSVKIVEIDVAEVGTKNNKICSFLLFYMPLHVVGAGDNVRLSDVHVVKF